MLEDLGVQVSEGLQQNRLVQGLNRLSSFP